MKILTILLLFSILSCGKKEQETDSLYSNPLAPNHEVLTDNIISVMSNHNPTIDSYDKALSVVDFKLGDQIILDSPKRFIQIYILFNVSQFSNYIEIQNIMTDSDAIAQELDKFRINFYSQLGISEEEFIQYSIDNGMAIQDFLAENSNFSDAYEFSISQTVH